MTMWAYESPVEGGEIIWRFGCPVTIRLKGVGEIKAVYQFPAYDQTCAVIHVESGRRIATIEDRHTGYPQQRAQAAVDERLANVDPARVLSTLRSAPVVNKTPRDVGTMRRLK